MGLAGELDREVEIVSLLSCIMEETLSSRRVLMNMGGNLVRGDMIMNGCLVRRMSEGDARGTWKARNVRCPEIYVSRSPRHETWEGHVQFREHHVVCSAHDAVKASSKDKSIVDSQNHTISYHYGVSFDDDD